MPLPVTAKLAFALIALGLSLPSLCAEAPDHTEADTLYTNAHFLTVDDRNPWATALAVGNGKILAIGTESDMNPFIGKNARIVDLGGRMVMPGIHDTHAHPIEAAVQKRLECNFSEEFLNGALEKIADCVHRAEPGAWIRGGQWDKSYFENQELLPREILDRLVPDNPVFLMDWSHHNAWVNSLALQLMEIDKNTPDPTGGKIRRALETGEATGILVDNAAYSVLARLPQYPLEQLADSLDWSLREVEKYGVTSLKEAIVTPQTMRAYAELTKRDALRIRIKTSLTWKSASALSHEEEIKQIENRSAYATDMLDPNFVKIMLDGVMMQYTSALLTPYPENTEIGADHYGQLMFDPDTLVRDVTMLDKMGLGIKIHATGDRAARVALDAIAASRIQNGDAGRIHEVSHAGLVEQSDIPRFAKLNVAAEMCPIVWYPMQGIDRAELVGLERMPAWRIRSLYEAGAIVSYGSDWPVINTPNPWPGIEAMVTRRDPDGRNEQVDYPEEAVDLMTAIRIVTRNGAAANNALESSGTLEVGKNADFIVLDRNVFEVSIDAVSETRVLMSVVGGNTIFDLR